MFRKSHYHHLLFRSSLALLSASTSTGVTSSSSPDGTFPERADWLDTTDKTSAVAASSDASAASSSSAVTSSGGGAVDIFGDRLDGTKLPSLHEKALGGVPIGIQHTTGELALRIAAGRSLKALKGESFKDAKPDVSVRAARALSAASRQTDHFLLADLDPDLDTVLFGTTTEEFEQNVKRMKVIVSTYTKWERWDNFYLYATRLLQIGTFGFAFVWWESACEKQLLQTAAEEYAAQHEQILKNLKESRERSIEYLIEDLKKFPPKIYPPRLVRNADGDMVVDDVKRHPMDTRPDEDWEADRKQILLERSAMQSATASDTEFLKRARRLLLPMSDDWTVVVREEMADYQRQKMDSMKYPKLSFDA